MNILSLIHFTFQKKICQQDSKLHMASLDVDFLFTNIPQAKPSIFVTATSAMAARIPNHHFHNFLNIASKDSIFTFKDKYYKQVDGVTMESPLGPPLANIFILCSFESKWLRDCTNDFKLVFYRRYVDDTFLLFFFS